jgi:hypothetical protein
MINSPTTSNYLHNHFGLIWLKNKDGKPKIGQLFINTPKPKINPDFSG